LFEAGRPVKAKREGLIRAPAARGQVMQRGGHAFMGPGQSRLPLSAMPAQA
jgi:hypothetical protein